MIDPLHVMAALGAAIPINVAWLYLLDRDRRDKPGDDTAMTSQDLCSLV
jgi:hypothetical protein